MAEGLYGEANRRLQKAIRDKNMAELTVVQGPMEVKTKKELARMNLGNSHKEKMREFLEISLLSLYIFYIFIFSDLIN